MSAAPLPQGKLRVYLGAAPGVGKTYAMLAEAQRRRIRGTDVVAGLVETHGRVFTAGRRAGTFVVRRPGRGGLIRRRQDEQDAQAALGPDAAPDAQAALVSHARRAIAQVGTLIADLRDGTAAGRGAGNLSTAGRP